MIFIAPIVEGQGEQQAVRRLLGRIAADAAPSAVLRLNEPIRIKAGSFIHDEGDCARYVSMASAKARQVPNGHVLILLDSEDDCPAQLGPTLLARARTVAHDVNIVVALAHREYETWFMAAAVSLRSIDGLRADLTPPANPESRRDAKGWLSHHMPYKYDPISHQLSMTSSFDLAAARAVGSFDRLYRKIAALLGA